MSSKCFIKSHQDYQAYPHRLSKFHRKLSSAVVSHDILNHFAKLFIQLTCSVFSSCGLCCCVLRRLGKITAHLHQSIKITWSTELKAFLYALLTWIRHISFFCKDFYVAPVLTIQTYQARCFSYQLKIVSACFFIILFPKFLVCLRSESIKVKVQIATWCKLLDKIHL